MTTHAHHISAVTTASSAQAVPGPATDALALREPAKTWGILPALGNLQSYISAVHRFPLLTLEEEQQLAHQFRDTNDLKAAQKLVLSHLRVVVSISRQYAGYGLPQADLIQEGNVGLMKAVRRFDPTMGVRLVSYALHWIKAEIHEYVIKNWRMVKVATTKAQRKLFFNLRSMKQAMLSPTAQQSTADTLALDAAAAPATDATDFGALQRTLSRSQANKIAKDLHVKLEEVLEMERRMSGGDVVLDPAPDANETEVYAPAQYLSDDRFDPVRALEQQEREAQSTTGVAAALAQLDERARRIVTERWLKVNDDGSGGMTLHELASEYGVSAERIRQIEMQAMKKMRLTLTA